MTKHIITKCDTKKEKKKHGLVDCETSLILRDIAISDAKMWKKLFIWT